MTEFRVEVVRIGPVSPLPNSDRLELTQVHGGYPTIIVKGQFKQGDLAVYCPIDSLVPTSRPEFAFLAKDAKADGFARIKAKKLRGTFSMGLLVALPESAAPGVPWAGATEGADMQEAFGIKKYDPDEANHNPSRPGGPGGSSGETEASPGFFPLYTDIEGLRKWGKVLEEGEEVVITEKIHGQNARYLYMEDRLWVGSHYHAKRRPGISEEKHEAWRESYDEYVRVFHSKWHRFKRWLGVDEELVAPVAPVPVPMTNWWRVAIDEDLDEKLTDAEGILVFGEIYGTQDLKYDAAPGELKFRAFDAKDVRTNRYLDWDEFRELMLKLDIAMIPLLFRGPWGHDLRSLSEGKTMLKRGIDHVREGFVVKPVKERSHERLGRVILKSVGEGYLLRK